MKKKTILTAITAAAISLTLLLLCLPTDAVNYRKGIPVGGTAKEQKAALLKAGAKYLDAQDGAMLYRHKYGGLDCTLQHSEDYPGMLAATFPVRDSWKALEKDYDRLWDTLVKEHGQPASQKYAFLHAGIYANIDEYQELLAGRCDWKAQWRPDNGIIELSITSNNDGECFCTIIWQTTQN